MTSGSKTLVERGRPALLAALLLLGASTAWAFDMPELMALLSRQKSGEARFTEQRFVRGMDGPLESSGTLSFTAPDKLTRRTLTPRPESMVVEGNTVTLSRGGRTRTLTLDSAPEMGGMVDALRGTLSGDGALLQRQFRSTLKGSGADWTLDLQPVDDRLAAQVRSVRLSGRQGDVLGVEMEFIGGDRSVMSITPGRGEGKSP
ncbi:outer membrane lipoprotein carrier protein LolA [Variovorax sp. J22R133]|uniref:LolA-related protein n=1 Tax=Variovorax brevis TaxID=3053503 RepID=UPI0025776633|nr:LolA-related protein [Variovorax sp. J22R133]MDM0112397.1 outer membrane lipoprotein carrier protein LolA [Variovorax sp. J22R133]